MASVVVLFGFIYWATAGLMDRQIDETIEAEIRGLAEQYRRRGLEGLSATIVDRVSRDPNGAAVYLLTDDEYTPIVGNLSHWPEAPSTVDGWTDFRLRDWGRDKSEEHLARARTFLLRGGLHLLVGRDVRELEAMRRLILNALAWGLAITIGLALGIGLMMSVGVMRRIEAFNQTGREIMEGDLSRRVPTNGNGDDFDQLAGNLNQMLERIEGLMTAVRQVSDNIAHDLRTPLARLQNRLEIARTEGPAQARLAVEQANEEVAGLLTTFNTLLRIARIESRDRRSAFGSLDLVQLAVDVGELYEPLTAEKNQQLVVEATGSLLVSGDRDMLFQVLVNLMDNAVKYTPEGGRVGLYVSMPEGIPTAVVSDSGPGIPATLRERVFQRFFRADSSRTTQGNGLGLSLVRAVMELHSATILLQDNSPGLRIVVRFDGKTGKGEDGSGIRE
ncbi:MAG: HAMP domain-containing histidine kinase [Gammaproteobacteria bacterium]|nr:HAMP domain-containing histidine kinase [Gammaproteobacteria bacterium]